MKHEQHTVEKQSGEVTAMLQAASPVVDIAKGGDHMRGLGKQRLPQFPLESDDDYKARCKSSWLFDGVGKAIDDMTGKVFEKPVALMEGNGKLSDWASDIDKEGRDLSNFARDVFESAIKMGLSFIMVDAPVRPDLVTVAQAETQGLRPSMAHVALVDVLGWKWVSTNNGPTLMQFRIMESVAKPDRSEFSDEKIPQIRVLDLVEGRVNVRLFQQNGKQEWVEVEGGGPTEQTEIMVTPVYTARTGFFTARPPLARLAEINMAHWRSQSDQSNIMHHARAPIKYFHGYAAEDIAAFKESPGYAFFSTNEAAKVGVVEHGGEAIGAGRQELKDMEFQMQAAGLQLVISKTGNNTATGDAIDEGKQNSLLSMWADNLKDALEIALGWMVDLGGLGSTSTEVFVNKDFTATALSHLTFEQVGKMFALGAIDAGLYIKEGVRRGILSEDVDPEQVKEDVLADAMGQPEVVDE